MKLLTGFLILLLSFNAGALDLTNEIRAKVKAISSLYGDGQAVLNMESIEVKDLVNSDNGYCVTLVSFNMEGFSAGNNSSQFLVFLKCRAKLGDFEPGLKFAASVIGIHPFYHHRNKYDINSANYRDHVVTITSPDIEVAFTNRNSIWWSLKPKISI